MGGTGVRSSRLTESSGVFPGDCVADPLSETCQPFSEVTNDFQHRRLLGDLSDETSGPEHTRRSGEKINFTDALRGYGQTIQGAGPRSAMLFRTLPADNQSQGHSCITSEQTW
jgi:hypothetical protein